jgi:excisionase family DNA binding protein
MAEYTILSAPLREELKSLIREVLAEGNGNGHHGHPKPVTAEELAEILRVDKATIYEWVKADKIPCLKVGRFLRFNLQAVLDSQKKKENKNENIP